MKTVWEIQQLIVKGYGVDLDYEDGTFFCDIYKGDVLKRERETTGCPDCNPGAQAPDSEYYAGTGRSLIDLPTAIENALTDMRERERAKAEALDLWRRA